MTRSSSRRTLLKAVPVFGAAALMGLSRTASSSTAQSPAEQDFDAGFPRQKMSAVEAVVSFSHFNVEKVHELVTARPALAKASWDWGFGDWETAIGAASHKGQRQIAKFLIEQGARPTIFTFAMLGEVDVVRSMINAIPGIQRTHGPHGFTLMYHARAGEQKAQSVVQYLEEVGDADVSEPGVDEIPADEQHAILGTYSFGDGEGESIQILIERNELRIKRPGRVGRKLARVEKYEYHPVGAPAVRVRFAASADKIDQMTIKDAALSIQASR